MNLLVTGWSNEFKDLGNAVGTLCRFACCDGGAKTLIIFPMDSRVIPVGFDFGLLSLLLCTAARILSPSSNFGIRGGYRGCQLVE